VYHLQAGLALGLSPHVPCPVDQTLKDGDHIGPLEIVAVPGHTPGCLAFHWRDRRALIVGDVVASWPDVAPTPGGSYEILASDGERTISAPAALAGGPPLAVPAPGLSLDGTRLEWPAVDGAAAYACRLSAGAAIHLQRISPDAACDLAALPAAGYLASIQALSADPEALAAGPAPALPARFDVSQARLGVLRREAGAPLALRAAGGRLDYGLVPGLALWMALAAPDGAPGGGVWSIEVTGPNLPPADPLRFELLENFTRRMVWAYDLPPAPGLYTLTARSGVEARLGPARQSRAEARVRVAVVEVRIAGR